VIGLEPLREGLSKLLLRFARLAARRQFIAEFRVAEFQRPIDKIAENIGEILVGGASKPFPSEARVRGFGRVCKQVIAPVIRWQKLDRIRHENAALLARREFAAVVIQPVKALDEINHLPGLATAKNGAGESDGVEDRKST